MQLEISTEDRATLLELVERALSDTRVEIRRTSTPEFHDRLSAEAERLDDILRRLRGLRPAA